MPDSPSTPTSPSDVGRLQSEIEFISELCSVVAGYSELQPILDWIVSKTTRLLDADECSIRLLSSDKATTKTVVMMDRSGPEAGTSTWPVALKNSVMGFLMVHKSELASSDVLNDSRFSGLRNLAAPVRALLAIPLVVDGQITGMIAASDRAPGREWTRSDAQLLAIVASHSAGVLEKARLRAEAEAKKILQLEKEKMEKELLVARDIQMRLVPERPLVAGPWVVDGRVIPARQVGGDYFDYYTIAPDRFAVAIADVSGKGVPAALLVSTVQGALRAFSDGARPPADVIRELNRAIARNAGAGRFVTLCYTEIDWTGGRLRYVNAGHNWPLVRRAGGGIVALQSGGVPLGLFEGATYEENEIPFGVGDALLLFSDGIPEAVDLFNTDFGDDRLERLWKTHADDSPGEFIARLMTEVADFRGAAAQSDDITAVVVAAHR